MYVPITACEELVVGRPAVTQGESPFGRYTAIFEDDGETGYFYALDSSAGEQPIVDAVHIYNGYDVSDGDRPSTVKVGWSASGQAAVLLINDQPHAVFDFEGRQGYCRTGFPPSGTGSPWSPSGHAWSEEALALFASDEP